MKKSENNKWSKVELVINFAKYQCWDGCHKIYLIMDEKTKEEFISYGYKLAYPSLNLLKEWYENSCYLRFIDAVKHNEENPNDGFFTLIGQGE